MKTNKTRSICVYTWTIYTYMHHHIPNKNDIPSWPSLCALWNTRPKWEICVESGCFHCFIRWFSVLFSKVLKSTTFVQKVPLLMKTNKTRSICVYTCTIYTYMHHIHHQIPSKYKIYLVGLPSILYERPGQNERDVCWISCFCCFSCAFQSFHVKFMKSITSIQRVPYFHENQQNQVNMCVYMYHLHIHAPPNTTKIWYT